MAYDLQKYSPEQRISIQALIDKTYGEPDNSVTTDYLASDRVTAENFNLRNNQVDGLLSYLRDADRDERARAINAETHLDNKYRRMVAALTSFSNWVLVPYVGTMASPVSLVLSTGESAIRGQYNQLPTIPYEVVFEAGVAQKLVAHYDGSLTVEAADYTPGADDLIVGDWTGSTYSGRTVVQPMDNALDLRNQLTVRETATLCKDLFVGGHAVIAGNLTVQGEYTTVNSTVVDVQDRVVHVNHNASLETPSLIAGLAVHRGMVTLNEAVAASQNVHETLLIGQDSVVVDGTYVLRAEAAGTTGQLIYSWNGVALPARSFLAGETLTIDGGPAGVLTFTVPAEEPALPAEDLVTVTGGEQRDHAGMVWDETQARWTLGFTAPDDSAIKAGRMDLRIQEGDLLFANDFKIAFKDATGTSDLTLATLDGSNDFILGNSTGVRHIRTNATLGDHKWYTGGVIGAAKATLLNSGRFLLGTEVDDGFSLLQVNGKGLFTDSVVIVNDSTDPLLTLKGAGAPRLLIEDTGEGGDAVVDFKLATGTTWRLWSSMSDTTNIFRLRDHESGLDRIEAHPGTLGKLLLQPSTGNVLIGTYEDDGANKVQINGSVQIKTGGSPYYGVKSTSGDAYVKIDRFANTHEAALGFYTNGVAKFHIGLDGDGTDNLHIGSDADFTSKWVSINVATGAVSMADTLLVHGDTALKSKLTVDGATLLKNTLTVNGATDLDATLNVDGATTLQSTLLGKGAATFNSTLNVKGATDLDATLNVDGAVTLQDTLLVKKAATLNSTLQVDDDLTVGVQKLVVDAQTGNVTGTGDVTLKGARMIKSELDTDQIVLGDSTLQGWIALPGTNRGSIDDGSVVLTSRYDAAKGSNANLKFRTSDGSTITDLGVWLRTGELGVNTVTPTEKLHVVGRGYFTMTSGFKIDPSGTDLVVLAADANDAIQFRSGATDIARMFTNGNVAIGKVADSGEKLQVEGTTYLNGATEVTGILTSTRPAAGDVSLYTKLEADAQARLAIFTDGKHEWGAGGAAARDTNLYRAGADHLKTDDALTALGNLTIGVNKLTVEATSGNTVVAGTLNVNGATDLDSTLNVDGATTLQSTLLGKGAATFNSTMQIDGNLTVGASKFTVESATGNTVVQGSADLRSSLDVTGQTRVQGKVLLGNRTATPAEMLHLQQAANVGLMLDNTTASTGRKWTLYSKTDGSFELNQNGVSKIGISTSALTFGTGAANLATTIHGTLSVTDDLVVGADKATIDAQTGNTALKGTLDVTGAASLASTLSVTGNTTVGGTLGVTGAASLANTLTVAGATTLQSTLAVTGATTLSNTLSVAETATFAKKVVIGKIPYAAPASDFELYHDSTNLVNRILARVATGNAHPLVYTVKVGAGTDRNILTIVPATGNLTLVKQDGTAQFQVADGTGTFRANLNAVTANFSGNLSVTGTGTIGNNTTIGGSLDVTGVTTLQSNLSVGGTALITGATTLSSTLDVAGDFKVAINKFTVAAASGNTVVAGTLGVTGAVSLTSTLSVGGATTLSGNATVGGSLGVTGATTLSNTLGVTGAVTLNSTLSVTGATTLSSTLSVTSNATIGGTATISGGNLKLDHATSNLLEFRNVGVAAPSYNTRSAGTKVLLHSNLGASSADYAIGIGTNMLWNSVPTATQQFKWYAGTANVATLDGSGNLTIAGDLTVGGTITRANVTDLEVSDRFLVANVTEGPSVAAPSVPTGLAIHRGQDEAGVARNRVGLVWNETGELFTLGYLKADNTALIANGEVNLKVKDITISGTTFVTNNLTVNGDTKVGNDNQDIVFTHAVEAPVDTRSRTFSYNADGTIKDVTEKDGATTVKLTTFSYDASGNIETSVVQIYDGGVVVKTITTTFTYNADGTLSGITKMVA